MEVDYRVREAAYFKNTRLPLASSTCGFFFYEPFFLYKITLDNRVAG
jgi:hypothetical protein